MPRSRRKVIRRSDSPWGQPRSDRGLSASRGSARRSAHGRNEGWLVGPTWLYVVAAIVIFAVAAAVAVVQATGSDDLTEPAPVQETATTPAEQSQSQQSSGSPEASDEVAQPATPVEAQQQIQDEEQTEGPLEQAEQQETDVQETLDEEQTDEQIDEQPAAPADEADNPLRGFLVPIRGACITEFANHLPSANREYRNDGVHEGLDFYQWASCTSINYGTEILAAKAGVVVRADLDYVEITPVDWQRFSDANWEGESILDELRGRQVWIDHGRGIVTRYAHLSAIADGIAEGVEVQRGQVIGYPGESGQQEVYANPGTDIHLHFEIRVGAGWLGQGETPEAARQLYLQAFGLAE